MLTQRRIYEFDDFRVDTGQFLLARSGHMTPITPTVFRILLTLLERAGQVVSKDELMRFVWPDSFVEEGNLNRNVSTLRKALGEKPCDHRYIETIPKTGYRFVAPVKGIDYQPPTGTTRKPVNGAVHNIVGRDAERKELRRAFQLAQQGHGGLVCVSGDVGLGKTALINAFLDDLVQDGQTFHLARGRGSGAARKMKRELLDFYQQVSPVHPLIVVIEDFQWSDVASVDLLAYLATRLESTRTLIVLSYRLDEMKINNHPFLQVRSDLSSRQISTEIRLGLLERRDVETYLAFEHPKLQPPEDYAGVLYAKSEGNPLFMRELVRGPGDFLESIRSLVQRKIDRVGETARELLVTASVQGREFDSAVLARALGMHSQDVEERLRVLDEVHGIIQRMREEELPDGRFTVRYRFVYGFYQEVCFASLAPTRKASLNASMAEALLTYYGN